MSAVRVNVSLPKELFLQLKANGVSLSALLQDAARDRLTGRTDSLQKLEAIRRILE